MLTPKDKNLQRFTCEAVPTSKIAMVSTDICYDARYLQRLSSRGIHLPEKMHHEAVLKRKCEFSAGRYCAFYAQKNLGIEIPSKVGIGSNREPVWPSGIAGSISHCQGKAVAVAAYQSDCKYLGVDIEPLIKPQTCSQIWDSILCEDEFKYRYHFLNEELFLTTIFSAKESLYKAIFPYINVIASFDTAKLTGVDPSSRVLYLSLSRSFNATLQHGCTFPIGYQMFTDKVILTLVRCNTKTIGV
ncbi:4'-phosphopantetheinyl transferase Npt [Grimontia marina]|uniref:Enterobactin synthase component D n=1 Tax=Grimontia marina TaxID=646534 RepID=A0A128F6L7_9GAMM|nr:4'-phosphopantetheinyl transferase Npt [Grimontia marina]